MPKNPSLEKYPELWGIRQDWDKPGRRIVSFHIDELQLLRKIPQVGEELWVKLVPCRGESDGKIIRAPWEPDVNMAAALAQVIEPSFRPDWVATVSEGGMKISVLYCGENYQFSLLEMILVCAYQHPLFPDPDIVIGKIVDAA